jgi:ParB-like chromosome segregation protein Spo0J
VLAGHARILACKYLGLTEVPTLCIDHLTPSQAKAFMIAVNRLAENADWDDRLLGELLKELSLEDLDFSIEATAFEMGEIDLLIQGLSEASESEDDPADVLPTDQPGLQANNAQSETLMKVCAILTRGDPAYPAIIAI